MRRAAKRPEEQVLRETREASSEGTGEGRLFTGIGISNGLGDDPTVEQTVSDIGGDGSIRTELLRLLSLPMTELDKKIPPGRLTSGQMLARVLLSKAIKDQDKGSIELVLDRIEGKAVKAAQNKTNNNHLTEQLDVVLDDLDKLTEKT